MQFNRVSLIAAKTN